MRTLNCQSTACGCILSSAVMLGAGAIALPAAMAETAVPARDFLNSIGVNSSIDARGETVEKTIACAQYLGVRWFRVGRGGKTANLIRIHAETGAKFAPGLGSGGTNVGQIVNRARELAAVGALLAIEGNNEPNNWRVVYNGETGGGRSSWLPVAKLQRDLYAAVKADPVLKPYPVWSISEGGAQIDNVGLQYLTIPAGANVRMPDGTKFADCANVHNYISHPNWSGLRDNHTWVAADPGPACRVDGLYGNYGRTWMKKFPGYSENELATLPRVTTETGCRIGDGVFSEEDQARLLLSLYLAQFKRGWSHTAVYLLKDRPDESGNQQYGFYGPDYAPRKAAVYLHNLTAILADTDSGAMKPGALSYTISDPPATVHDLLLQKSNGDFCLVIWNENYKTRGSAPVTVSLGDRASSVSVYNPTVGTDAVATHANVESLDLALGPHPLILAIRGGSVHARAIR